MQPDATVIFDRKLWEFVNSFASWLSALGTIAAVITALYLARRESRIDLRVNAGVRVMMIEGGGPRAKYVSVEVTNVAPRAAIVTGVYWANWPRLVRWLLRTHIGVWIPPRNALSRGMPVSLVDGESARWMMPLADLGVNFADMAEPDLPGWVRWLKTMSVRIGISTSTGHTFERRVEKGIRREFLKITKR